MPGWTIRTMMVEEDQAVAAGGRYAGRMIKRTDRLTATLVDLAINLARAQGAAAGAAALFRLGLPLELAHRVLLRPAERRGREWPTAQPRKPEVALVPAR